MPATEFRLELELGSELEPPRVGDPRGHLVGVSPNVVGSPPGDRVVVEQVEDVTYEAEPGRLVQVEGLLEPEVEEVLVVVPVFSFGLRLDNHLVRLVGGGKPA